MKNLKKRIVRHGYDYVMLKGGMCLFWWQVYRTRREFDFAKQQG